MKNKKLYFSIIAIIATWLLLPYHVKRALTYWYPEIKDHEIFENRTIEKSDSAYEWAFHTNYNKKGPSQAQRDTLEQYQSIAFLVIQNGSILYEEYWDDYDENSQTNSFSMAKSIVGLLIGAAIDDGYIKSLDQPVGDFLPHFKEGNNQQLTIRHLLTMSSGSNWDEKYTSPFSMTTEAYYGNDLEALVNRLEIIETPGKFFNYKSGDTQILAHLLKAATGKTLSDYTAEKLWHPLGAHSDALWSLDRENGYEKAYCCLNSNARDFALLGQLILKKGNWKGQQLINEEYIMESIRPASHLKDPKTNEAIKHYGQQWWIINQDSIQMPYARGILGQYVIAVPHKNAVIVRLGHKRSKGKINHHPSDIYTYIQAGLDIMD